MGEVLKLQERDFNCCLTRALATFTPQKLGRKVGHEHAAGAPAKGTFAASRLLWNVKVQKFAKLILNGRPQYGHTVDPNTAISAALTAAQPCATAE